MEENIHNIESEQAGLPDFFYVGDEESGENPEGIYQAYTPDSDIKQALLEHLASIGKQMPYDGRLPEFMYYSGEYHDTSSSDQDEIHIDAEGEDLKSQWEYWLETCPDKS